MSKVRKVSVLDVSPPEAKAEPQQSTTRLSRKKQKILASKIPKSKTEAQTDDIHLSESQDAEDVDCMPLNPSENMPASLARNIAPIDRLFENFDELKMNGWAKDQKLEGCMKFSPVENLEHVDVPSHGSPSTYPMSTLLKQAKGSPTKPNSQTTNGPNETATNQHVAISQPSILAQIQAKEVDVQALAELTRALDKKVVDADDHPLNSDHHHHFSTGLEGLTGSRCSRLTRWAQRHQMLDPSAVHGVTLLSIHGKELALAGSEFGMGAGASGMVSNSKAFVLHKLSA